MAPPPDTAAPVEVYYANCAAVRAAGKARYIGASPGTGPDWTATETAWLARPDPWQTNPADPEQGPACLLLSQVSGKAPSDEQGQIGARRARVGLWNANADTQPDVIPDQRAMNPLLTRLDQAEREVLAQMLSEAFEGGVHETLATLYDAEIPPFDTAYEGTPFNDFVGRLDGWIWPEGQTRS
jgi:hypothetical protein